MEDSIAWKESGWFYVRPNQVVRDQSPLNQHLRITATYLFLKDSRSRALRGQSKRGSGPGGSA